jgi:hypothetical protein
MVGSLNRAKPANPSFYGMSKHTLEKTKNDKPVSGLLFKVLLIQRHLSETTRLVIYQARIKNDTLPLLL